MPAYDQKEYHFYNQITKQTFCGRRKDLCEAYDLPSAGISKMINGELNHSQGWVIITRSFKDYINKKKYTIYHKQRREADREWDLVLMNLRQWQANNGVHETVTIRELREQEEARMT